MADPISTRLDGLLAKVEATYGTDSVPVVGTDGVRISQRVWNVVTTDYAWENLRTDAVTGSPFPAPPAVPHGSQAALDFLCEVKGPGVAYSSSIKPEVDPLLQACGWSSTGDFTGGLEKYTYAILTSAHKSATVYAYGGGLEFQIVGVRGTVNLIMRAGELAALRFQMRGILEAVAGVALPTITSYDATSPVASVGVGLSIGPYDPDWTQAEFSMGTNVQRFDSGNAPDGIHMFDWLLLDPVFTITARNPKASGSGAFDTAAFNPWADATARTSRAIDATIAIAQYNRAKLSIASAYVNRPAPAENNGATAMDLRYTVTDSAMTLTFD